MNSSRDHAWRQWWRLQFTKLKHRHKVWFAYFCLVGVCILYVYPGTHNDIAIYLVIGSFSIVWLVIDIWCQLQKSVDATVFKDMVEAREPILSTIRQLLKKRQLVNTRKEIRIVGGRLLRISNMLEELATEIGKGELTCRGSARIRVFCVDPEVIQKLDYPFIRDARKFRDKMNQYAKKIEENCEMILKCNRVNDGGKCDIEFEVIYYPNIPTHYTFLIGQEVLFWGAYTWDGKDEDFNGPVNPCFRLDAKKDATFSDMRDWMLNGTDFALEYAEHITGKRRVAPAEGADDGRG